MYILIPVVPSQAPTFAWAGNTSSISINVTWNILQSQFWTGIPRGYLLYYGLEEELMSSSGSKENTTMVVTLLPTDSALEIKNLSKYKEYRFWMNAFTIKGSGINNTAIKVLTDEASK